MGVARSALLWVSENRKLRQSLPRYKFIRRAVSRFMPGEKLEDAITAAKDLKQRSINSILTQLGENIADVQEANGVRDHYLQALELVHESGLDAYISVKLTQLGLDLDEELCSNHLLAIIEKAEKLKNMVWIDMEQSAYVDHTLRIYSKARQAHGNVGVCLQSYLYRTRRDLEALLPLVPAIRLVKGAYAEPADIAYARKADVDANYFELARILLAQRKNGVQIGIATHDKALIRKVQMEAEKQALSKSDYEFQMLYGIQTGLQEQLANAGYRMRALISYGTYWFPWYVRRLAERPANVMFVLKNIV